MPGAEDSSSSSSEDDEDLYCGADDPDVQRHDLARRVLSGPDGEAARAQLDRVISAAVEDPMRRRLKARSSGFRNLAARDGASDFLEVAGFVAVTSGALLVLPTAAVPDARAAVEMLRSVAKARGTAAPTGPAPPARNGEAAVEPPPQPAAAAAAAAEAAAAAAAAAVAEPPPAPTAPPASRWPLSLTSGCRVEIHGVEAKPELNGQRGVAFKV
jgi:hypothetical protein